MKKLMFAALAALAMVGAANAAATWTFDASWMSGTTQYAVKDGFNATTVGGTSENPVGAGYAVYFICGVDKDTSASKANAILAGLRDGLTMEQTISTKGLTLLASSTTDKDSYVKSVTASVDEKLYYQSGKNTLLACITAVLGENDVFLDASQGNVKNPNFIGTAYATNTRRDIDGTAEFGKDGWYAFSVPEPTSGLLLLLGVAGLALRRKRA